MTIRARTIRALVCSSLDGIDALTVGDLARPPLRDGSVRIRVAASAVNYPDILVTQGLYQFKPELPFAPGLECAGDVAEVAEDVSGVAVGDRVFGFVPHGAHAREVVVEAAAVFPMPESMPYATGASLALTYGTGYHGLVDRAGLAEGETLLVLGAAGGVGMAAVQIGTALGARVLAAVSSDEKATAVSAAGADTVIRYDRQRLRDRVREAVPDGVDVVYDPVGGDMTEAALRSTAWGGRHLVVGFAAGAIPRIPTNLTLLKGSSLVGVFWGRFAELEPGHNRANFDALTRWWTEGKIEPVISQRFPLSDAGDALRVMAERRAIGKIVIEP